MRADDQAPCEGLDVLTGAPPCLSEAVIDVPSTEEYDYPSCIIVESTFVHHSLMEQNTFVHLLRMYQKPHFYAIAYFWPSGPCNLAAFACDSSKKTNRNAIALSHVADALHAKSAEVRVHGNSRR